MWTIAFALENVMKKLAERQPEIHIEDFDYKNRGSVLWADIFREALNETFFTGVTVRLLFRISCFRLWLLFVVRYWKEIDLWLSRKLINQIDWNSKIRNRNINVDKWKTVTLRSRTINLNVNQDIESNQLCNTFIILNLVRNDLLQ